MCPGAICQAQRRVRVRVPALRLHLRGLTSVAGQGRVRFKESFIDTIPSPTPTLQCCDGCRMGKEYRA